MPTGDAQSTHVADIKERGARPARVMLVNDGSVRHGHLPAREIHKASPALGAPVMEGCTGKIGSAHDSGKGSRRHCGATILADRAWIASVHELPAGHPVPGTSATYCATPCW